MTGAPRGTVVTELKEGSRKLLSLASLGICYMLCLGAKGVINWVISHLGDTGVQRETRVMSSMDAKGGLRDHRMESTRSTQGDLSPSGHEEGESGGSRVGS